MQEKVKKFNKERGVYTGRMPVYARLMDIQSEMGELVKEYLKHSKYGTEEFNLEEDFKMEFGDCLYSMLSLADELDFSADEYLDKVIAKYKARINNHGNMGSGR